MKKSSDLIELKKYNRRLLKFAAESGLALRHLSDSIAVIMIAEGYVNLTKALHEIGKLEELMALENRLEGKFLKPFKDELWKRDGPSPVGGAVGHMLQVKIFEGRSFP